MQRKIQWLAQGCAFACLALMLLAAPAGEATAAGLDYQVYKRVDQGMQVFEFYTPRGEILLHLPGEIMGGETVSGRIELRSARQSRGGFDLEPYFIAIDGELTSATAGTLVWNVPEALPGVVGFIELISASGETLEIGEVEVCQIEPVEPRPDVGLLTALPAVVTTGGVTRFSDESPFTLPQFAQRGRLIEISGAFDGDFSTTDVIVDGLVAEKLTESQHGLVVRNPATRLGPMEVSVREGRVETLGSVSNFDFVMSTGSQKMAVGDAVTVQLTAQGLIGVRQAIPVVATNWTPEVVMLRGVDPCSFHYSILPEHIGADGRATLEIEGDVVGEGEFRMTAHFTVIAIKHVKNVTFPPHVSDFTFHPGPHLRGTTWEPHVTGVSFSPKGHKKNVTWQSHTTNVTFSNHPHESGATWAPHSSGISFPTDHADGTSWEQHTAGVTFGQPNHTSGVTHKPHQAGFTYNPEGHKSGFTFAPHTGSVSFPPPTHSSGVSWPSHQTGVSWPQ